MRKKKKSEILSLKRKKLYDRKKSADKFSLIDEDDLGSNHKSTKLQVKFKITSKANLTEFLRGVLDKLNKDQNSLDKNDESLLASIGDLADKCDQILSRSSANSM